MSAEPRADAAQKEVTTMNTNEHHNEEFTPQGTPPNGEPRESDDSQGRGPREQGHRGSGRGRVPGGRGGRPEGGFGRGFVPDDFADLAMGPRWGRGPGGRGGPGGRRGPGRGRRGDVRNAILALLLEGPANGYQLIEGIKEKSQDLWRPGAGSIYPALSLLEEEGLITPIELDGRKVYELTEAGREHIASHAEETSEPWARVAQPHQGFVSVRKELHGLVLALQQVVLEGDEEQVAKARGVLDRARRDIYRLLAGDDVS